MHHHVNAWLVDVSARLAAPRRTSGGRFRGRAQPHRAAASATAAGCSPRARQHLLLLLKCGMAAPRAAVPASRGEGQDHHHQLYPLCARQGPAERYYNYDTDAPTKRVLLQERGRARQVCGHGGVLLGGQGVGACIRGLPKRSERVRERGGASSSPSSLPVPALAPRGGRHGTPQNIRSVCPACCSVAAAATAAAAKHTFAQAGRAWPSRGTCAASPACHTKKYEQKVELALQTLYGTHARTLGQHVSREHRRRGKPRHASLSHQQPQRCWGRASQQQAPRAPPAVSLHGG